MVRILLCGIIIAICCSCQGSDKVAKVINVIEEHPEAHTIMFFDPNTTFISEGDKSVLSKRLDYITFSVGFCYIKFIGQKEFRVLVNEPEYGHRCSLYYPISNSHDSFFLRLDHCQYFYLTENNELIASFITKTSEERMMEYYNILYNKGLSIKRPTLEKLRLLIEKYRDGIEYYTFDE